MSARIGVGLIALVLAAGCGEAVSITPPVEHNSPPTIWTLRSTIHHNDTYDELLRASDREGDSVTIGVVALPNWLTFDTATHVLHGSPGEESIGGAHEVVVTASDGQLRTTATFPIAVLLAPCIERAVFNDPTISEYVLPFPPGPTVEVLQTYCGTGSHTRDNQLAYDFRTPFGDPVVAARAGRVTEVVDDWADSDKDPFHFNQIVIVHDDDTFAFYAHLKHESFVVQVGDRVSQGQTIAASGESGTPTGCAAFMECAVLHFGVYKRSWSLDIPINFRNADGPLDARGGLSAGTFYTVLP